MNFKKIKGKVYTAFSAIAAFFAAYLATFGQHLAFAETTVDLTILTDLLPTIVTLMVFSMVIGMLKKFGKI